MSDRIFYDKLNSIRKKFKTELDPFSGHMDYTEGQTGFDCRINTCDFGVILEPRDNLIVMVVNFYQESQRRIEIRYQEEEADWFLYSDTVKWDEQVVEVEPLKADYVDEVIDEFVRYVKIKSEN